MAEASRSPCDFEKLEFWSQLNTLMRRLSGLTYDFDKLKPENIDFLGLSLELSDLGGT